MQQLSPHSEHLKRALLQHQVAFYTKVITQRTPLLPQVLLFILHQGQHFTLQQAVSKESVKEVVRTYAIEHQIGGGIIDIAGQILIRTAQALRDSELTFSDIIPHSIAYELIEKFSELNRLHQYAIYTFIQNPRFTDLASNIASAILMPALSDQFSLRIANYTPKIDTLHRVTKKIKEKLYAKSEDELTHVLEHLFNNLKYRISLTPELALTQKESIQDFLSVAWQDLAHQPIASFTKQVAEIDFTEFLVLIYEIWKNLRTTDDFSVWINAGVEQFFETYGDYTLYELYSEVGLNESHIHMEIERFVYPFLLAMHEAKLLEPIIHRILSAYYEDADTLSFLDQLTQQLGTPTT